MAMKLSKQLVLLFRGGGGAVAPLVATTTGAAETVTLQSIGVSASTVIDWGDGSTDTITGTAQRTHEYADAGSYEITFDDVTNLNAFDVRDTKLSVYTSALTSAVIERFTVVNSNGNIDTAYMSSWSLRDFRLVSSSADITINSADMLSWIIDDVWLVDNVSNNATININSSHMSAFDPRAWQYKNIDVNANVVFDTADIDAWSPQQFQLFSISNATTLTVASDSIRNFIEATSFNMSDAFLTTAQVDAIIDELYAQALAGTRTATGGTINLGGASNGTITGAVQAPVGAPANAGEKAYELVNDSLGEGFNTWTTVTVNT